ncbi:helix-turn-helix domain-containing protein [Kineosporia rhizophila]|uniref:helix-turn-helix domain-containing protein n=1 Tax=Kineosporia TaxID=49184 RepID=UPI001E4D8C27|nr:MULTISPECIES: helix-turn-helix transcriptional regulator [Kineosporia]MCE0534803.1 helix-turn-helix domain-containing protein [Kineosporia rhizophila]GLY19268.1 transcriptional regulator [Kineosporia sp. NBRC 101677]
MPGTRPNPTASRRALAARLRRLRIAAGKSAEDAARELMVSASKISRLESGDRAPQPRDVRDLARFYGASPEDVQQLQELVLESRRKGWWSHYGTRDEQVEVFIGLESVATRIDAYENLRWPGLLQIPDVTRAVLDPLKHSENLSTDFIEDQVKLRGERQQRLLDGRLALHAIMDESVFRRHFPPGVAERQMRHLTDLCRALDNLTVQVVPFSVGPYLGMDGAFWILRDSEVVDSEDLVVVEGVSDSSFIYRSAQVRIYRDLFTSISRSQALGENESLAWIERCARQRKD